MMDLKDGFMFLSNEKGSNRKQVLTYDGKQYTNGLPDMKWEKGVVVE